ncbi:hypothetical protein R1flu_009193 [Riccia fluitans]|uniref:Replication factor A C-terminal domain-containing protein n=1 Tax=Riccia fluitans TaxID=41844 RepID=A0ABD1Z1E0_9MARC
MNESYVEDVTIRVSVARFNRGPHFYQGCPFCQKKLSNAVKTCRMCGNCITCIVSYYSLKLVLRDETGNIDATVCKAGRDFTGVSANEFTAIEVENRKEAIELLRRNLGLQWEVDLKIDDSKQGIYVRIDRA